MTGKSFFKLCEKEFSFLKEEYNFLIVDKREFDWGYRFFLKNNSTGIIITFEHRDFYVFLKICKLENGSFLKDIGEIRPDSKLNNFDYENLLLIRSPESIYPEYTDDTIFNDNLIKKVIKHHANNLKKFAHDILQGDFTIFSELEKIVKERARKFALKKWGKNARKYGWEVDR